VSVLNGTGAAEQATTTGEALSKLGFDVVGEGDTTSVGQVSETLVAYDGATKGAEAKAEAVAASMSGAVTLADEPSLVGSGAAVTVVTGTSFAVNPPPTASTTAPSGRSSTTTSPAGGTTPSTSTTVPTAPGFTAPTAANQTLQPWDPRSCSASGGEGV
jgi:hypothetical protein